SLSSRCDKGVFQQNRSISALRKLPNSTLGPQVSRRLNTASPPGAAAAAPARDVFVLWLAVLVQCGGDARNRTFAGDRRHAQFRQGGAQGHGGAHAAEHPRRIADNRGGSPEVFLEEVVEQVFQCGRDAVVVFAADDDETVDAAVER